MEIQFKNTPNKSYKIGDEIIWLSRSAAVVGLLIFRNIETNQDFVLVEKRSQKMDNPGKWCLPCGYIDWDENGWECLIREVYEETSFFIPKYEHKIVFDNDGQPFYVNTSISENRQNIALRYGLIFDLKTEDFPYNIEHFKNDEISEIKIISIYDIDNYEFTFGHDKIIKNFINKYL